MGLEFSLGSLGLSFLISSDLGLDCFPVHLDVFGVLFEPLVRLLLVVLLQESLAVGDHRVHVRFVLDGDVQGTVPLVLLDVQFDGSVEQSRVKQDLLCFFRFLAVHCQRRVSGRFGGQFFDIIDELNLVSFIDCSESNFDGIQFSAVNSHGS